MILDVAECDGRNIDADSLLGAQYFDVPRRNFDHQSAIWANPRLFAAIHAYRFAAGSVNRERVPILGPQKRPDPVDHNSLPLIRKAIRFKFAAHHFAGDGARRKRVQCAFMQRPSWPSDWPTVERHFPVRRRTVESSESMALPGPPRLAPSGIEY